MAKWELFANLIDAAMSRLGNIVSLCIPLMAITIFVIVVLRYGFNTGAIAAQESVQYLHSIVFMLGAAIALSADEHVRVDIFYRQFSDRQKTWVNTMGHIVLTLPVCVLIGAGSLGYVGDSWAALEASPEPGGLPWVYLLKSLIPLMAALLLLQAIAQIIRGLLCLSIKENSP